MWDLIVSVPGHCLLFYLPYCFYDQDNKLVREIEKNKCSNPRNK